MNILLLAHIYKNKHNIIVNSIVRILRSNGHNIEYEFSPCVYYDCILVYNKKHLQKLKYYSLETKIPIVYIFCISDITTEYLIDINIVNKIIVFKDKIQNISLPSTTKCEYFHMLFPSVIEMPTSENFSNNKKPIIYIDIDNDYFNAMVILKLLLFINSSFDYQIYIYSKRDNIKSLFNKHVSIIKNQSFADKYIKCADIVIGSGYPIMTAIQLQKKAIVIGEKGYGGIVTNENIIDHYYNFFQGRNGGKFDEIIPLDLLEEDLQTQISNSEQKELINKIFKLTRQESERFLITIEKLISLFRLGEATKISLLYKLNPDYDIIKLNKKYWLYNKLSGKLYERFNETECIIILKFKEQNKIDKVLDSFSKEYRSDIEIFIYDLIETDILVKNY